MYCAKWNSRTADQPDIALSQAIQNNPEMINHEQLKLQQDQNVKRIKSETGLNTSLFAMYGRSKTSEEFNGVYDQPDKSQQFSVGLNVPIVDWGRSKGRVSMAESNREVTMATIKQERLDFEMDIFQSVMEFNLQASQVKNSAKPIL